MADTLTVTDNRTGKQYQIPIKDGVIRATDLRQVKTEADDAGLMTYDPAFMNTAACRSRITYIDGDKGILEYPGPPDRATRRTLHVSGDCLPHPLRRAPDGAAAGELDPRHHPAHDAPREHQEADGRLSVPTRTRWASS